MRYFNYTVTTAAGWWGRRSFLRHWWRFYGRDPYWVPPPYHALGRTLRPGTAGGAGDRQPQLVVLEALPRPGRKSEEGAVLPLAGELERPVGLAIALREASGQALLALPRVVNDAETVVRLLEAVAEATGAQTVVGPTHLSPLLGAGALASHWNRPPPLHTPYNPPYLPGLLREVMEQAATGHLYALPVADAPEPASEGLAAIVPFRPARLASELLPLLNAAAEGALFTPAHVDASFLLRWLAQYPLSGYLALVDDEPAGFILLQPDLAPLQRRSGGGRTFVGRLWVRLALARRKPEAGRVVLGAVAPPWRRQGIGRQLLEAARAHARSEGWERLTTGPLEQASPAAALLSAAGAVAEQRYELFRWQAPVRGWW
ncbi:MAG: GNAT family N-acetyltransferase [Candidatus Promineifilaceae bacterium]|nr:GNAT family N-acetyltransferase [Candidatus Promineifilaceae bacterium]